MVDFCKQLELELDSANRELQARGKDIETLTTALEYARKDLSLNARLDRTGTAGQEVGHGQ